MSVILFAGPEKAGKTTLCKGLLARGNPRVRYRHWSQIDSWVDFRGPLIEDLQSPDVVLWDRGWPCMCVYDHLMGRDTEWLWTKNWWKADLHLGRLLRTNGFCHVLLGPSANVLRATRTPDDLPVDPQEEKSMYSLYANINYLPTNDGYPDQRLTSVVLSQIDHLLARDNSPLVAPPEHCGFRDSPVMVVGEARSMSGILKGEPALSSRIMGMMFDDHRDLRFAFHTNADVLMPSDLADRRLVVALGDKAARDLEVCRKIAARSGVDVPWAKVRHPGYVYRWAHGGGRMNPAESELLNGAGLMAKDHAVLRRASDGLRVPDELVGRG